jgi:hypothetical protein
LFCITPVRKGSHASDTGADFEANSRADSIDTAAGFKPGGERHSRTFLIDALAKKNVSEVDIAGLNSDANLTLVGLWHINIITQVK